MSRSKSKRVNKAESNPRTKGASIRTERGQPRIINSNYFVNQQRNIDLQMPQSLYTYDCMMDCDAVSTSVNTNAKAVVKACYAGEVVSSGTSTSQVAADFLNYNFRNMASGTWLEFLRNAVTSVQYGYSLQNIVLHQKGYGPYAKSWTLHKLAPRDQKTLYAWLFDKDFREVEGFVQRPNSKNNINVNSQYVDGGLSSSNPFIYDNMYNLNDIKYPVLKKYQYLHFTYNSTNNNPEGNSPLNGCYKAWKEKSLIEQYEVLGVTKDLGGLLILRVPSELIEEADDASNNPNSAIEYAALQSDTGKLHSGESSMMVLASDTYDNGQKFLYDVEIKGVQGGGRQYQTSDIIDQKRKAIYNCFGASNVILGQDGGGSLALSTAKTSLHGQFIEDSILQIVDVINNQLIPRILEQNNIYLDFKDMPTFQYKDPDELDFDIYSKAIMRIGGVEKLTPALYEWLTKKAGGPIEGIRDLDFTSKGDSRSGESKGSSGTGTSSNKRDASTANGENAANKSFVKVDTFKNKDVYQDSEGDDLLFIDPDERGI